MIASVHTCALSGVDSCLVEVEADVSKGRSGFGIIGLADNTVREAAERVKAAILRSGFQMPRRVLINLAPAEIRKEGSSFDLSIAIAVLRASGQVSIAPEKRIVFFGELSLEGRVKAVRGIVPLVLQAGTLAIDRAIVPVENHHEASLIPDIESVPVSSLREVCLYLTEGTVPRTHSRGPRASSSAGVTKKSFSDVVGQERAKRAFEIAACGGHHLLMVGPPGCGKSMMAERFQSLLPPLSRLETREAVTIHGAAGLPVERLLSGERPYRSPHYGASAVALVGGGTVPRPGEISLAHRGVLFLDELPEFRRSALESLRIPLEKGSVHIGRARGSVEFPARFQLIAAMNPCPCGRAGVPGATCLCRQYDIEQYLKKISQPLLDRIDLRVQLDAVSVEAINMAKGKRSVETQAEEVQEHRKRVLVERGQLAAELENRQLGSIAHLSTAADKLLKQIVQKHGMSARGYFRLLRVGRTIADLDNSATLQCQHIAEAAQFRSMSLM